MAETQLKNLNDAGQLQQGEVNDGLTATPRVDILEKDDELLLFADVPGVNSEGLDLHFENGELTLHGRRAARNDGERSVRRESAVNSYHRTFRIGENIAADKISAELKDGVLTLRLPKVEAIRPRKIEVRAG